METVDPAVFRRLAAESRAKRAADDVLSQFLAALHPVEVEASRAEVLRLGTDWKSLVTGPQLRLGKVIDLGALTPEMEGLAGCWGLSIPILQAIGNDSVGFASAGALGPMRTEEEIAAEAAILRGTGLFGFRNYNHAFFQASGFVSIDPFTGERLVSTHSFVIGQLHIAYRFRGLETFYVVVGGIGGVVRFLGIPRLNCVVLNAVSGETDGHKQWSLGLYRNLMINILRHGEELAGILATPRHETGVALGSWPNLGHYIWNELAGLEEALQVHGPGAIRHVALGPYSHLPVQELFPEIADRAMTVYDNPHEAFAATFRLPYQHIRPFGVGIRPSLRDRIFKVSEAHVPLDLQARMKQLAAEKFVMWVNLRSHDKTWARQVDGHITVLCRLAADVGDMAVILDGWTDTRAAGDAIRAGLGPEIEVIDTIGCSVFETFLWARVAHLYSAVVSTGLHFTSHFASRPGVAHANTAHLRQQSFWSLISPGSCPITFLDPSDVQDDGGLYANYDFDPDLLYRRLRELVELHYPDRLVRKRDAASSAGPSAGMPGYNASYRIVS